MSLWKTNILLFSVMAMFGGGFVAMKYLLHFMEPESVALIRALTGFSFFLLPALRRWPKNFPWRLHGPRLVICALTGFFINQLLFVLGMKRTLASHSTVIVASIPVLTLFFVALLRTERPNLLRWGGFAISLLGIAYVAEVDKAQWTSSQFLGDLLIFINAASYSFYLVYYRSLSSKYSAVWLTWALFTFGMLFFLPVGTPSLLRETWNFESGFVWFALAYVLVFQTVLPYLAIAYLLRHTTSSHIAQGIYIQPLVAITGASLFLGEILSSRLLIAAFLVLGGVWVSQTKLLHVKRKNESQGEDHRPNRGRRFG